jgi:hypothetical protein
MPFDPLSIFKPAKQRHHHHILLFGAPSKQPVYAALLHTSSAQVVVRRIDLSKHSQWSIQTELLGEAHLGHEEVELCDLVDTIVSLDPRARTNMRHLFEAMRAQRQFLEGPGAESVEVWLARLTTNKPSLLYSLEHSSSVPRGYLA